MAETPKAVPKVAIDLDAEIARAAQELAGKAQLPEGAPLEGVGEALRAASRLYAMLRDCEAAPPRLEEAADRLVGLARLVALHPDADVAAPRAQALELAASALRERGRVQDAEALAAEAAERWLEAADDERDRQKEFFLRSTDAFVAAGKMDRAAGTYARAVKLGEDPFEASRAMIPSRGAHRLKLVVLLLSAGEEEEARAVNDALTADLTKYFEQKVPREKFEEALDASRALAEAHAIAGNRAGERQARLGAIDLSLALSRRDAKRAQSAPDADAALFWVDLALSDALKLGDDKLFLETYRLAAKGLLESALAVMEDGTEGTRRAASVRLLFEAGRRFQLLGDQDAAQECHARAYEISPKYSPADRRPSDEMAWALFLVKSRSPDPEQAEVHLKNAEAFVKALTQAAGVGPDHPSARLRMLVLREAFYRRIGRESKHREVVDIIRVAATEGAAAAAERAATLYRAGRFADCRAALDEAIAYLNRGGGKEPVARDLARWRSLCYCHEPAGEPPESAAQGRARRDAPFDPRALGYDWRRIEDALLAMDPPAEFHTIRDELQFIKGRAPKPKT